MDTKGCDRSAISAHNSVDFGKTHNLELNRDNSEVQNLNCRPNEKVGLQGWDVYVLEFASQGPSTTTFRDGHERKETHQT